jgi:hypothetical protein
MIGPIGFYTIRGQENNKIWFSEGAAIADKQHLFGFIHPDGVFFTEPRFDEAHNFSEGLHTSN